MFINRHTKIVFGIVIALVGQHFFAMEQTAASTASAGVATVPAVAAAPVVAVEGTPEWQLIEAIKNNNLSVVEELINTYKGIQNRTIDGSGHTPLHLAAYYKYLTIAQFLLKNGAQVNTTTAGGYTPLHGAIMDPEQAIPSNNLAMAQFLVENGADVNVTTSMGVTPLIFAARINKREIAQFLVEKGADVNAKTIGNATALHWAVGNNNLALAKYLVQHGSDVFARYYKSADAYHIVEENYGTAIGIACTMCFDDIADEEAKHIAEQIAKDIAQYLAEQMASRQALLALLALEGLVPEVTRTINDSNTPGGRIVKSFPPEDIGRIFKPCLIAALTEQ